MSFATDQHNMSIDSVESMVSSATNLSDSTVTTTTTPNSSISISKPPPIKTSGKLTKQTVKENKPLPITPTSETHDFESSLPDETDTVNPLEEIVPDQSKKSTTTSVIKVTKSHDDDNDNNNDNNDDYNDDDDDKEKEDDEDPDAEYKLIARRLFDEDFVSIKPAEYTQFLAAGDKDSSKIRGYYMSYFDWSPNLLKSTRILCSKLYLKGESQEIDRILSAFTKSYIRQHRNNPFSTQNFEQIYIVIYSLILLNTALHNAELDKKSRISKHDFIKNTLETFINQQTKKSLGIKEKIAIETELAKYYENLAHRELNLKNSEPTSSSSNHERRMSKMSKSDMSESSDQHLALARQPSGSSTWSNDTSTTSNTTFRRTSFSLQRYNTGSTEMSTNRKPPGRMGLARTLAGESKPDGMYSLSNHSMLSQSTATNGLGKRSSFDQILGRTSKADIILIEEEPEDGDEDEQTIDYDNSEINDTLELSGAPFLKEGLLMYKEDTSERRSIFSRSTNFANVFVVVSQGTLLIFSFDEKLKRKKRAARQIANNGEDEVGDGNWLKSSLMIGSHNLCSCYAESSGKSWYLKLSNKKKLLFAAGTEAVAEEFKNSCNFWAARATAIPSMEESQSSINYGFNQLDGILKHTENFKRLKIHKYSTVPIGVNKTSHDLQYQFLHTVSYYNNLERKLMELKENQKKFSLLIPECQNTTNRKIVTHNFVLKMDEVESSLRKYRNYCKALALGLQKKLELDDDNDSAEYSEVKEVLNQLGLLNDKKSDSHPRKFSLDKTGFESPLHSLMVIEEENSSE